MKIILSSVVALVVLTGCSTIDPQLQVDLEIAQEYKQQAYAKQKLQEKWWESFGSKELNSFVEKALKQSPDILSTYENLQQAKIALNSAGAEYYPSLDLRASSSLADSSKASNTESSSASVALSYELDVWDRIGASIRAQEANLALTLYDFEALKISYASDVVENYISYCATKEQRELAKRNLQIAQETLNILQTRYDVGAVDELSLRRQKISYLSQKDRVVSLKNQELNYKHALAVLLGQNPSNFSVLGISLEDLKLVEVGAGLPSELLLSRPDIAAAEAAIEQNKALIQVADANRFPRFSLSSSAGLASAELLSLSDPTRTVDLGLGLSYNIFDMGRLKNNVLIEESKAKQTLQSYRKTLLQAFAEVENSLSALSMAKEQFILSKEKLTQAQQSYFLAKVQYDSGAIDFTTFLESQETLFSTKEDFVDKKEANLQNLLTLYKALGGGWQGKLQK